MLKQRVISAAIMLAVFLVFIFFVNDFWFRLLLSLMAALAAWEWCRLSGFKSPLPAQGLAAIFGGLVLLLLMLPLSEGTVRWIALLATLFWASVPIVFYRQPERRQIGDSVDYLLLLTGLLLISACALFLSRLHSETTGGSPWICLTVLSIAWIMDIGAYFTGKRYGKRKLAPKISPGKTIEGALGGLMATLIFLTLILALPTSLGEHGVSIVLGTVFAALASIVGDLYESRLKRAAGVKDSSQMIPGHGGILDRIDGQLASIPVFFFFWTWM